MNELVQKEKWKRQKESVRKRLEAQIKASGGGKRSAGGWEYDFDDSGVYRRVAFYIKSWHDNHEVASDALLRKYSEELVKAKSNWELVGFFSDSGDSHEAFDEMIQNCREGEIDLVITRWFTDFSQTASGCIAALRELTGMNPPVGVWFAGAHVYTLADETVEAYVADYYKKRRETIGFPPDFWGVPSDWCKEASQ